MGSATLNLFKQKSPGLPGLHYLLNYLNLHLHPLVRQVPPVTRQVYDFIRHLHAPYDLAEYRVLPVEEVRVLDDYEELRPRAVGVLGAGHRDYPPLVRGVAELGLDVRAGAAHAVGRFIRPLGVRVPALYHEAGYYPVEYRAVVEALL